MANYKYCIVPMCKSTTIKCPQKLFIHVPKEEARRKKWCLLMKRDDLLSAKTTCYVCEDHFDLPNDVENYMKVKMMGGALYLKKSVQPHIFNCQKSGILHKRSASEKRKRKKFVDELIEKENSSKSIALNNAEKSPDQQMSPDIAVVDVGVEKETLVNKGVQAKTNYRSKGTQVTSKLQVKNALLSPIKVKTTHTAVMCDITNEKQEKVALEMEEAKETEVLEMEEVGSDYFEEDTVSEPELEDDEIFKQNMQFMSLMAIKRNSRLFIGITPETYFIVKLLSQKVNVSTRDLLITLKKVRCGDTYARLGIDFGMSASNVCRIFKSSIKFLKLCLQELVFWPSVEKIQRKLPVAFRARYGKTQSIIDCFEIEIEKPSNSLYQALTWSNYKVCNTLKYLVSTTPDGFINFISNGYGGRATDCMIVLDSGYLEKLTPGTMVMADRGFKGIAFALEDKKCSLVRPPSVFEGNPCTPDEVKSAKQIAALRIHVERVIKRFREFTMLLPHACVDKQLIQMFDDVIIVACGLINLQPLLIKN